MTPAAKDGASQDTVHCVAGPRPGGRRPIRLRRRRAPGSRRPRPGAYIVPSGAPRSAKGTQPSRRYQGDQPLERLRRRRQPPPGRSRRSRGPRGTPAPPRQPPPRPARPRSPPGRSAARRQGGETAAAKAKQEQQRTKQQQAAGVQGQRWRRSSGWRKYSSTGTPVLTSTAARQKAPGTRWTWGFSKVCVVEVSNFLSGTEGMTKPRLLPSGRTARSPVGDFGPLIFVAREGPPTWAAGPVKPLGTAWERSSITRPTAPNLRVRGRGKRRTCHDL